MGIDEFCMLWLPWATQRKAWHKMAVWTATQRGWLSKQPFCAILFNVSPTVTKACENSSTGEKIKINAKSLSYFQELVSYVVLHTVVSLFHTLVTLCT